MAFKGYSYNKEIVGDSGTGGEGNIQTSGLYPITIERLEFKETDNPKYDGGVRQEFVIAYSLKDKKGNLFGLGINNTNGEMNKRTQKIINNLMTILKNTKDLSEPIKTTITRQNGDTAEVYHFKEFENKEVIVYIRAKYRQYQGKIYKDLQVIDFFQKDTKASVDELLNKDPNKYGKRYESMKASKYDLHIDYEGVTEEEAKQWEEEQKQRRGGQVQQTNSTQDEDDEVPF